MCNDSMVFDVDALAQLGQDLSLVGGEFANADVNSKRIADAVGHRGLAETVRSFADSWDDTREKMTESVQGLAEGATVLAESLIELDEAEANALTGAASPDTAGVGVPDATGPV